MQSTGSDLAAEVSLIESLGHRYVDGLIISPIRITHELLRALAMAAAPVVVIGNLPDGALVDNVRTDSEGGLRLAVEHLLAAGARRLALVNGPVDTIPGQGRTQGFQTTAAAAGLSGGDTAIEYATDFTYPAGLVAARSLLGRFRPDAVACGNDLIAFAVIRALAELGLSVPGDVLVTGVDDTDLAEMQLPSLTSVSLESARRGSLAAAMMLSRIASPGLPPRLEQVPPRLVIRESSRLPAASPSAG